MCVSVWGHIFVYKCFAVAYISSRIMDVLLLLGNRLDSLFGATKFVMVQSLITKLLFCQITPWYMLIL